jgi:hypothetical protein
VLVPLPPHPPNPPPPKPQTPIPNPHINNIIFYLIIKIIKYNFLIKINNLELINKKIKDKI